MLLSAKNQYPHLDFDAAVETIMTLIFIVIILFLLILPWVNFVRIKDLEKEVERLKSLLNTQRFALDKNPSNAPTINEQTQQKTHTHPAQLIVKQTKRAIKPAKVSEQTPIKPIKEAKTFNFEKQFAAKLPVWIGGVALALAGFFLVKYSIDNNLLSHTVRVVLGAIFALVLLITAHYLRKKPDIGNTLRIAQALSGAGIAVLYVTLFAATTLYQLIPALIGLFGMGIVTAMAVILSLRHGVAIALLGLVGGFLTPFLVGSSLPNVWITFSYLYFVFIGLLFVIKQQGWWCLSLPTILGIFSWVIWWLLHGALATDSLCLGLFLIAICLTIVLFSKGKIEDRLISKIPRLCLILLVSALPLYSWALLQAQLSLGSLNGCYLAFYHWQSSGWLILTKSYMALCRGYQ